MANEIVEAGNKEEETPEFDLSSLSGSERAAILLLSLSDKIPSAIFSTQDTLDF